MNEVREFIEDMTKRHGLRVMQCPHTCPDDLKEGEKCLCYRRTCWLWWGYDQNKTDYSYMAWSDDEYPEYHLDFHKNIVRSLLISLGEWNEDESNQPIWGSGLREIYGSSGNIFYYEEEGSKRRASQRVD